MSLPRVKWRRLPIIDLCEQHVDCVNRTAPVVDEPTPFKMIRTTNVRNGFIDIENVRYVSEAIYKRWTRRLVPRQGDIILTREAPLGDVGKVRTDDLIFLGQRLYHFRPDPSKLDPDFLLFSLMAPDLQDQIRGFGSGATVEHMRLGDIPRLVIDVPSIEEQRRIGGRLAAYDDLFENNKRRIRILEEMARALYREWFGNFQFSGGRTRTSQGLPGGWALARLGDLAEETRRNVTKGSLQAEARYVGLEHIPRRSLALDAWEELTELGSNKLEFKKGEVLFGKIRPYFHKVSVAPFDGVCSADTIVIRATRPDDYGLVVATVSSDAFVRHATVTSNGSKMPRANWAVLREYPVAVPNRAIARRFTDFVTNVVGLQQNLVFQNMNLRQTRDLLLPRLLSGQLSLAETEGNPVLVAEPEAVPS